MQKMYGKRITKPFPFEIVSKFGTSSYLDMCHKVICQVSTSTRSVYPGTAYVCLHGPGGSAVSSIHFLSSRNICGWLLCTYLNCVM